MSVMIPASRYETAAKLLERDRGMDGQIARALVWLHVQRNDPRDADRIAEDIADEVWACSRVQSPAYDTTVAKERTCQGAPNLRRVWRAHV